MGVLVTDDGGAMAPLSHPVRLFTYEPLHSDAFFGYA